LAAVEHVDLRSVCLAVCAYSHVFFSHEKRQQSSSIGKTNWPAENNETTAVQETRTKVNDREDSVPPQDNYKETTDQGFILLNRLMRFKK
jgi:hypothetical protein